MCMCSEHFRMSVFAWMLKHIAAGDRPLRRRMEVHLVFDVWFDLDAHLRCSKKKYSHN